MACGFAYLVPRRFRLRVAVLTALLTLAIPSIALAEIHETAGVIQQTASFTVIEPPAAPFTVHHSMLLFMPGAEAPPHRHGGPGFITVLSGELTLVENGVEARYWPGDSVVQVTAGLYKVANYAAQGTTLMATYVTPHGEEVIAVPDAPDAPDLTPEALAEAEWDFETAPASFDLIQTVTTFQAAATTGSLIADGDILKTVVTGSLVITTNGEQQSVSAGDSVLIGAGQEYMIENMTESDAMTISTQLLPHLEPEPKVPEIVTDEYDSVLPEAGRAHDEPKMFWFLLMTAATLIGIGGVMRISAGTGTRFHVFRNR